MINAINQLNELVWGLPTMLLILAVGVYLTVKTHFFQLTYFPNAFLVFMRKFTDKQKDNSGVSGFQALCTALAATVGTGNIAGVAGAVCLGGPGAVFWMWVCAFFGMILKCAEAVLAVKFRSQNQDGEYIGGPMYYMENGMGKRWKWMACLYAFFGVVAAFGVGNATQVNAVLGGIHAAAASYGYSVSAGLDLLLAAGIAIFIAVVLSGGARRIGNLTQMLVPFAAVAYIFLGIGVLVVRADVIPYAIGQMIAGALDPGAVTGGIVGSVFICCRTGAARGVFTNEAGMGTAAIAHASADVRHPVEQGLLGIIEVFLDTIVICTITGLVILCSGIPIPYGSDPGATLTSSAFSVIYGKWSGVIIALCLALFAIATIVGWSFYGLRCAQYLFGQGVWRIFVALQVVTVILSAVLQTRVVWLMAECINGLMAIPNLIALLYLSPEFINSINEYILAYIPRRDTNENFHKRKPL